MGGNARITFKQFFLEGGNARVGEEAADRVDFSKVERQELIKQVLGNLKDLNAQFKKQFGFPLWKKDSFVASGAVLSGSAKAFINTEIPDEEFTKHKPSMGDIDLQCDENMRDEVSDFLMPGRKFGTMTYKGRVASQFGEQIITLMHFPKWDINIQMDFEFVDFDKLGMPTDWAAFSHSSSWEDIKAGVKGVFHKYMVGAIDFGWEDTVTVMTPAMKTSKVKITHPFAFSVAKGLRAKYRELTDEEKKAKGLSGTVWVELKTGDSKYINSVKEIFKILFRKEPSSADITKFNSFVGIVELLKDLDKKQQEKIFQEFITRMWGKGAQELYREDPKRDMAEKSAAANYIMDKIPGLKSFQSKIDTIVTEYYKTYR